MTKSFSDALIVMVDETPDIVSFIEWLTTPTVGDCILIQITNYYITIKHHSLANVYFTTYKHNMCLYVYNII